MNEEKFLVQEPENIEHEATIEEVELRVAQSSTVDYIDIGEPEEFVVEIEESVGWANGNGNITHASLPDKDAPNQHTIGAIEGLQDILDRLSVIKDTVYATKGGFAEFRPWLKQGYYDTEDLYQGTGGVGYFVSLVTAQDNLDGNNIYIDICKKINNDSTVDTNDVYGVTVAHSGFCGYHGDTDNPNYAQVCLLGDVKVRVSAEEHQKINIGDYVVPNELGYASKAENGVGFKVISKGRIETAWFYVEIALVPQNDNIARVVQKIEETRLNLDKITITLGDLSDKLGEVEGTHVQLGQDFKGLQDLVGEATGKIDTQLPAMQQMLDDAKAVATKADEAIAKVQLEYVEAVSKANDAQSAVEGALSDVAELQKNMEPLAAWKGEDGSEGVTGFLAQATKDHTELSSLTSVFGDDGSNLTAIMQKIDENGAAIQHLVSHIDKYILGEHSPAYGLSLDETTIIQPGTIYVTTKTDNLTEEYVTEEGNIQFTFEYKMSYIWAANDVGSYMWSPYKPVSTATSYLAGAEDGDLWYCWQGVYNNKGDKLLYEPGTLYCWNETKGLWAAVASINNNSTARVTGLIRQTADELRSVYTDLEGNVSDMRQTVDSIETRVATAEGNITQIEQTAEDITMGVYDPAEGSTSLGLLLNGMQSMSNYGGRMRILHVLEMPTITGNRYSQPPMWDGTKFVFAEGAVKDDGTYYSYPGDPTKYCKVVSDGYEVYTIGSQAIALLETQVDDNKSEIQNLTNFKTTTSQTLTTLTQQSDANSAKIASVAAGEYVVCSDINIQPTADELAQIPDMKYTSAPKWTDGKFVFSEEASADGTYYMLEGDDTRYYKLLPDGKGYEQYELASTGSASIMQTVTQQGSSIGMIVDNNGVMGGVLVEAINKQTTATIGADKITLNSSNETVQTKLTTEAGKISQIVEAIGEDGKVTAASITTAINQGGSTAQISADQIKFDGLVSFANTSDLNALKGEAIKSVEVQYASSASATDAPDKDSTDWSSVTPTWEDGKYIWQRTVVIYANNTSSMSEPACIQGAKGKDGQDGQDGTGVAIQGTAYVPEDINDNSIGKSYTLYSDEQCQTQIVNAQSGDSYLVDGYLFVYSGVNNDFTCVGEIQGPPGEDGYTPQKGVDYFDGTNGENGTSIIWKGSFDAAPSNAENGWAYYNTEQKASYVYQDGTWYQMSIDGVDGQKGEDGSSIIWKGELSDAPDDPVKNWVYRDTDDGKVYIYNGTGWELMVLDGNDGTEGKDGSNGLSVFITYNNSVDTPNTPSGDGTSDGWHTNATSDSIWMSQKIAADADLGNWGEPIKIKGSDGQDGEDGRGISEVEEYYQLNNDSTTAPTTWGTDIQTPTKDNKYLWNYEKTIYTSGDPTTTTPIIIATYTEDGRSVGSVVNYYLASSQATGISKDAITATTPQTTDETNKYLWNYEAVFDTDGNMISETDPCIIGVHGATGAQGETGRGITAVAPQYYLSTSDTQCQDGQWQDDEPTWESGKYIWTRSKITWDDDTITYTDPVLASALNSANETAKGALDCGNYAYDMAQSTQARLVAWCAENDETLIDGSQIYTGSIGAQQIATGAITIGDVSVYAPITWDGNAKDLTSFQFQLWVPDGALYKISEQVPSKKQLKNATIILNSDVSVKRSVWSISDYEVDEDTGEVLSYRAQFTTDSNNCNIFVQYKDGMYEKGLYVPKSNDGTYVAAICFDLSGLFTTDSVSNLTVIDGGQIATGTITANQIATSAIKSKNYQQPDTTSGVYANAGTFFDLSTGSITSKNFVIDGDGNVSFKGTIDATGGNIGDFTINGAIYNNKTSYKDSNSGVYIGTDGIGLGAGAFYVTSAGFLYATNVQIAGNSQVGGCQITNGNLTVTSDHIKSLTVDKIVTNNGLIRGYNGTTGSYDYTTSGICMCVSADKQGDNSVPHYDYIVATSNEGAALKVQYYNQAVSRASISVGIQNDNNTDIEDDISYAAITADKITLNGYQIQFEAV